MRLRRGCIRDRIKKSRLAEMRCQPATAWHTVPVVWLGIALAAASIAGCIVTIVLAVRQPDPPLDVDTGVRIVGMPLARKDEPVAQP